MTLICIITGIIYIIILGHTTLDEIRNVTSSKHQQSSIEMLQRPHDIVNNGYYQHNIPSNQSINILVVYGPVGHQHIYALAKEVARGAESVIINSTQNNKHTIENHVIVHMKSITTANFTHVLDADAIIIGSPVYNANTHPDVQAWINTWDIRHDFSYKLGAAFVTAGGISAGEEATMWSILRSMMIFRMIIVGGGGSWRGAFGASAVMDEDPWRQCPSFEKGLPSFFPKACYDDGGDESYLVHPMFLKKGFDLGARVASLAQHIKR